MALTMSPLSTNQFQELMPMRSLWLIVSLLLPFTAMVAYSSEQSAPFWTEKSTYSEGDRLYIVGTATGSPTIETGRKQALEAARAELASQFHVKVEETKGVRLNTQMTYEHKNANGFDVFRLTWVSEDDLKQLARKIKTQSKGGGPAESEIEKVLRQLVATQDRTELEKLRIPFEARELISRAYAGDSKGVSLLLKAGMEVDVTSMEESALSAAARGNFPKIMKALLDRGANPDVQRNSQQLVVWNSIDLRGYTPLMIAVVNRSLEGVRLLLESCANVEIKNAKGETARTLAAGQPNTAITKLLSEANLLCSKRISE